MPKTSESACLLSEAQIEALARPFVGMVDQILEYYKDPEHERAFQEWYLKKYGHPAPEGV